MKLEEYKQRYIAEKEKVEGNLLVIEAEAKRVKAIALRFEGALAFINELEQAEAAEAAKLNQKLESRESLSEEDIQRALGSPLEPDPSEDHVVELVSEEPKSPVEPVPVPFKKRRKQNVSR